MGDRFLPEGLSHGVEGEPRVGRVAQRREKADETRVAALERNPKGKRFFREVERAASCVKHQLGGREVNHEEIGLQEIAVCDEVEERFVEHFGRNAVVFDMLPHHVAGFGDPEEALLEKKVFHERETERNRSRKTLCFGKDGFLVVVEDGNLESEGVLVGKRQGEIGEASAPGLPEFFGNVQKRIESGRTAGRQLLAVLEGQLLVCRNALFPGDGTALLNEAANLRNGGFKRRTAYAHKNRLRVARVRTVGRVRSGANMHDEDGLPVLFEATEAEKRKDRGIDPVPRDADDLRFRVFRIGDARDCAVPIDAHVEVAAEGVGERNEFPGDAVVEVLQEGGDVGFAGRDGFHRSIFLPSFDRYCIEFGRMGWKNLENSIVFRRKGEGVHGENPLGLSWCTSVSNVKPRYSAVLLRFDEKPRENRFLPAGGVEEGGFMKTS